MSTLYVNHMLHHLQVILQEYMLRTNYHSPVESYYYRTVVSMQYMQIRFLLTISNIPTCGSEVHWNRKIEQMLEMIHASFHTRQVGPYFQWMETPKLIHHAHHMLYYLRMCMISYLKDIPTDRSLDKSVIYRRIIYTFYRQFNALLERQHTSGYDGYLIHWNSIYRDIIDLVHEKFQTYQDNSYYDWPQR